MVLGLTGGIGCGKSTAAAFFAEAGFQVTDADQLAREVLTSPDCVAKLRARWGAQCLDSTGQPDRAWIAAKVFTVVAERAFLESVTHPEVARRRAIVLADRSRHHLVESPLLFEKNLQADFDAVVCIACSEASQSSRLASRGLTPEQISRRLQSQLTLGEKVKRSDYVIWNDGDRAFLKAQVTALLERLLGANNRG